MLMGTHGQLYRTNMDGYDNVGAIITYINQLVAKKCHIKELMQKISANDEYGRISADSHGGAFSVCYVCMNNEGYCQQTRTVQLDNSHAHARAYLHRHPEARGKTAEQILVNREFLVDWLKHYMFSPERN